MPGSTGRPAIPRTCRAHVSRVVRLRTFSFSCKRMQRNIVRVLAEPPSSPQNLTINFVDQSTVMLGWNPPEYSGGRTDTVYRLRCDACTPGIVQYTPNTVRRCNSKRFRKTICSPFSVTHRVRHPSHIVFVATCYFQETFNDTKVTITGLNAVTTYRFQVFSENGVSRLSTKITPEFADVTVTTEASIVSSIINIRVTSVKSSEITLSWEAPSANDGGESDGDPVETYEVPLQFVAACARVTRDVRCRRCVSRKATAATRRPCSRRNSPPRSPASCRGPSTAYR